MNIHSLKEAPQIILFVLFSFIVLMSISFVLKHNSLFFSLKPQTVYAQITPGSLRVTVEPQLPGPHSQVLITLESFTTDINTATIEWYENDALKRSGIGELRHTLQTGELGSSLELIIIIRDRSGQILTHNQIFRPIDIDILWETTDSYAPPFYRGKTLASSESIVKAVAMPVARSEISSLQESSYVYTWRLNQKTIGELSGFQKNTFTYRNSYLNRSDTLVVSVRDANSGSDIGQKTEFISMRNPILQFYNVTPSFGIRTHRAVEQLSLFGESATLQAIPYFLHPKNLKSGNLTYKWSIGPNTVDFGYDANTFVIESNQLTSGEVPISVEIRNSERLFQQTDGEILVYVE